VARERARKEISAGGVVVRRSPEGTWFLLIRDGHRNWGFPKGHLHDGEGPEEAARREIGEETGLDDLALHDALGQIDWYFRFRGDLIHKFCHFFLFSSDAGDPVPQGEEGISACAWLSFEEAAARLAHDNARRVLQAARLLIESGALDASGPV
jgi:8-oxo-dGTP pyrophosphatase MutT (NUDIX family)